MRLNLPNIVFPSSEINDMKLKVCGSSLHSKFETEYKEAIVQCTKASRSPSWWGFRLAPEVLRPCLKADSSGWIMSPIRASCFLCFSFAFWEEDWKGNRRREDGRLKTALSCISTDLKRISRCMVSGRAFFP